MRNAIGCVLFLVFSVSQLSAAVDANWDSATNELSVNIYNGPDHVEVVESGGVVQVKVTGTPITIYNQFGQATTPIVGYVNSIEITGSALADTIDCSAVKSANGFTNVASVTLHGNQGNDTITGSDFSDVIHGGGGHDTLYGRAGNDIFYGDSGADSAVGEGGNDALIDYQYGADQLDSCAAILCDWDGTDLTVTSVGDDAIDLEAIANGSNLDINLYGHNVIAVTNSSIKKLEIHGSPYNDTIDCEYTSLTYDYVEIHGYAGNDTLDGTNGRDRFFGGDDNDTIDGHGGTDYLIDPNVANFRSFRQRCRATS